MSHAKWTKFRKQYGHFRGEKKKKSFVCTLNFYEIEVALSVIINDFTHFPFTFLLLNFFFVFLIINTLFSASACFPCKKNSVYQRELAYR